jgi:glycosyltransferase involved in cell wall biosynthesis
MAISVVICCYNSAERLPATLSHLAAQAFEGEWEVVLVDNNSEDGTAELAQRVWTEFDNKAQLRVIDEVKRGVHHARFTGIKNAQYDIVVFCDDDNWLSRNYLSTAETLMQDRSIGVYGGRGEAAFEVAEPDWFRQYEAVFGCGRQAPVDGSLGWDQVGMYSAGMVIRREAAMKILDSGYRSYFAARDDKRLSGGEDFELVVLIRTMGYKAAYSDELVFRHFMPESRMKWTYLVRLVKGSTINAAPAFVYADTLRKLYTGDRKYNISWLKDMAKAVYGGLLIKVRRPADIQIIWVRISGTLRSVLQNRSHYPEYEQEVERIYYLTHHKD